MSRLSDTSPEAQRALVEALRRMTPQEKWLRIGEHWNEARRQHESAERSRNPSVTVEEIHEAWLRKTLGESCPRGGGEPVRTGAGQGRQKCSHVFDAIAHSSGSSTSQINSRARMISPTDRVC